MSSLLVCFGERFVDNVEPVIFLYEPYKISSPEDRIRLLLLSAKVIFLMVEVERGVIKFDNEGDNDSENNCFPFFHFKNPRHENFLHLEAL